MGKKKLVLLFTALVIILGLYLAYTSIDRQGKSIIQLETFPSDTKVRVDGREMGRGTIYLEPGNYWIEASREGFKDYSGSLEVDSTTSSFAIMLQSESTEAGEVYKKAHQRDYDRALKVSYDAQLESGQVFGEKNPIIKHLPQKTFTYSIGYIKDQSDSSGNSIIVTIDADEGYKQTALNYIRQLGFDPTDLNIIFRDYENPFPL